MVDDTFTLTLDKAVAGGRTLARLDGRIVLVAGGIPGERVRVTMERTGKGVAFARVVAIEEASPDRVTPDADPHCGGLAFAHVSYPRQLDLKRGIVEDAMGRIGRLRDLPTIDVVGSPVREWRIRARLHAQGRRVGFFREGTHSLCDAAPSGQLAPGLLESRPGHDGSPAAGSDPKRRGAPRDADGARRRAGRAPRTVAPPAAPRRRVGWRGTARRAVRRRPTGAPA